MEIRELEYLITIAEEKSISAAAEKLHMAQSSLSQFLTNYETNLGSKLFVRTARGVRLTYSGELFLKYAKHILLDFKQAENELWDIEELKRGRIDFGISSYRGAYLFPKVLKEFYNTYPGIEVIIHEHDSLWLEDKILSGELDMALVAKNHSSNRIDIEAVMQDEICIVTTNDHPVMQYVHSSPSPWVEMKDAAQFKFLLSPSTTILGGVALEEFEKCSMPIIAVNKMLTADFAASMARAGIALAFTYRSCARAQENVTYLAIGPKGRYIDLVLEFPKGGYRSKATKLLTKLLLASLKSNN